MHLLVYQPPNLPNPVLLRGWGGLAGLDSNPVTRRGWGGLWGLGDNGDGPSPQQEASAISGAAGGIVQAIKGNPVGGAGTSALAIAPFTGPAAPFVAIAGAVAEILGAIGVGKGCGQTCITASNYANQAEALMNQNLNAYVSLTTRYQSQQTQALQNFDQLWAGLVSACSNPALNDAGKNCISQRQSGSCAFKTSPGQGCQPSQSNCWVNCVYSPGGPNGSGNACGDWFIFYRDPIANDPCVQPDPPASGSTSTTASTTGLNANMTPLLLIGGVVLLLAMGGL